MTPRSQRLESVCRVAGERADQAARDYAARREALEQEHERLAQLRGFRREYEKKLCVVGGSGIGAYRLRDYNAFLARIDAAIAEQQRRLEGIETETDALRQDWLKRWGNAQALDRLVSRYRQEEQRQVLRREQRLHDEQAQRRIPHGHEDGDRSS